MDGDYEERYWGERAETIMPHVFDLNTFI